jgi:ribonuclease Y
MKGGSSAGGETPGDRGGHRIDLIVDDTPEAVVLSSFDPLRLEVARLSRNGSLRRPGSIGPIEEIVKKVRTEVTSINKETGELISFDEGVPSLHPE